MLIISVDDNIQKLFSVIASAMHGTLRARRHITVRSLFSDALARLSLYKKSTALCYNILVEVCGVALSIEKAVRLDHKPGCQSLASITYYIHAK